MKVYNTEKKKFFYQAASEKDRFFGSEDVAQNCVNDYKSTNTTLIALRFSRLHSMATQFLVH